MRSDGHALVYLSDARKENNDFVMEAIRQDGHAVSYASEGKSPILQLEYIGFLFYRQHAGFTDVALKQ